MCRETESNAEHRGEVASLAAIAAGPRRGTR